MSWLKSLTKKIKNAVCRDLDISKETVFSASAAMAIGVASGILPIWGFQMAFAAALATALNLNRIVVLVFTNITLPPFIPFILYASYLIGTWIFGIESDLDIDNISLESLGTNFVAYAVGAIVLSLISGLATFVVSYGIIFVFRKLKPNKNKNYDNSKIPEER